MNCYLKTLLFFCFSISSITVKPQGCIGCLVNITGLDSLSYTVNSGEILCIDSTGEFTGTITLNGGSVCNKGMFQPRSAIFSSGAITNYAFIRFDGLINLDNGFSFINSQTGILNLGDDFTITNATFDNSGIATIKKTITFIAGTLNNSAILNCKALSGLSVSTIINSGIITKDEL